MFNLRFKLTPFWLFIILLTVLIISIVFGINTLKREGFVSYYYNKQPLNTVDVSGYYNSGVYKLYDNTFFDKKNGNVLYVYGEPYSETRDASGITSASTVDLSGTSISTVIINDRYGNTYPYSKTANGIPLATVPSNVPQITQLVDSYSPFEITSTPASSNITNNTLFYIPWGKKTYMHIIDVSTNSAAETSQNIAGFLFNNDLAPVMKKYTTNDSSFSLPTSVVSNPSVNLWIVDASHGDLYQINNSVYFKKSNGTLFVKNSESTLKYDVYKRDSSTSGVGIKYSASEYATDNSSNIASVGFNPWTIVEPQSKRLILFMPDEKNTVVAIIKRTNSVKNYEIEHVKLFNADGNLINPTNGQVITGNTPIPTASANATVSTTVATATPVSSTPTLPNLQSEDYYKWYWYWNTTGGTTLPVHFSEDYLLKTQIVPPVCPACSSQVACSSCSSKADGDRDGVDKSNTPISDSYNKTVDTTSDLLKSTGSGATNLLKSTGSGATNLAKETASGTADLLKSAGSGAANLLKDSASGIGNFAKSAASGTVGLAKETVSGTVDLAKDTVSGTVGLIKDAGKGTSDFLKSSNAQQNVYSQQSYAQPNTSIGYNASPVQGSYGVSTKTTSAPLIAGQPVGPMNPYTYNGTLSQKPSSNFLPLTADFSKFGR